MACTQMELLNLGSLDVAGYLSGSLQSPRENMEVGAGTTGNCYKTCGQCRPLEEFLETFRHSLSWHAGTLGSRRSSPADGAVFPEVHADSTRGRLIPATSKRGRLDSLSCADRRRAIPFTIGSSPRRSLRFPMSCARVRLRGVQGELRQQHGHSSAEGGRGCTCAVMPSREQAFANARLASNRQRRTQ